MITSEFLNGGCLLVKFLHDLIVEVEVLIFDRPQLVSCFNITSVNLS